MAVMKLIVLSAAMVLGVGEMRSCTLFTVIVYVVLIWIYARYMNKLDIEYGVDEGEDE